MESRFTIPKFEESAHLYSQSSSAFKSESCTKPSKDIQGRPCARQEQNAMHARIFRWDFIPFFLDVWFGDVQNFIQALVNESLQTLVDSFNPKIQGASVTMIPSGIGKSVPISVCFHLHHTMVTIDTHLESWVRYFSRRSVLLWSLWVW